MTRPAAPGPRRPRRGHVVLAVVVLGCLGTLGVASASSLGVTSRGASVLQRSAPCSGPAAVQAALQQNPKHYDGVAVSLPAGCTNRTVSVTLATPKGDVTGSALITSSGVIDFGQTYKGDTVTSAMVTATADGWSLAVSWTAP